MEIIQLTETSRLRVVYDNDAENPMDWEGGMTEKDYPYQQWAAGEVYGVSLERAEMYVHPTKPPIIDWECVDSLWGNYLDESYTAQTVAREHFTLTDDELEALGGK